MDYLFLTGATGLLGSYLLRDLLAAEVRLAVLARSSKLATARQRIETQIAHWEKQVGRTLPRPVVLEGDLTRSDLGLGKEGVAWAKRNCHAFMHNAASLTFHGEGRDTEPWRSNLDGAANVVDFCDAAGIREFHHVSTAYVCGLRKDRVLETELDVGQEHGNDYEVSKFEAEKLVRSAACLDSVTVYRPGIIFGDSRTGYTSTFHGFYVPLKLVSTVITKLAHVSESREMLVAAVQMASLRLQEVLHLTGHESKNFVPVDWVSAAMTEIYCNESHHGGTYHLTPRSRAPIATVKRVMEESFLKFAELTYKSTEATFDWAEFERYFLDGMSVYRSYWGEDPDFDYSNTARALPHLPCPELDEAMIQRMCKFAIESNFGWPVRPPVRPELEINEHLGQLPHVNGRPISTDNSVFLGLQVNGEGGGQWELVLRDGRIVAAEPGLSSRCTATYYLNANTFKRLKASETSVEEVLNTGRVVIEGNGVPMDQLARVLKRVADRSFQDAD